MNPSTQAASHPTEGDLVRYLDRQVTEAERRWMLAHFARCEACELQLRALDEQSRIVAGFLAELHENVAPDELTRARALAAVRRAETTRPQRTGLPGGGWRVAAAVAVVALATAGIEPVRAWVAERWAELAGGDSGRAEEIVPVSVDRSGSVVSMRPSSDVFVLELSSLQQAGEVTVELRDVEQISAQVINGAGEFPVVLPAGLRIENYSGSQASYRITLPEETRLVQIFAGGVPVVVLPVEDATLPWSRTFSLDAGQARR